MKIAEAKAKWLKHIDGLGLSPLNKTLWGKWFDDFKETPEDRARLTEFFQKVASGEQYMPFVSFNMSDQNVDLQQAMKYGSEVLGIEWFERLIITDHVSGEVYKTTATYLVVKGEVRRQVHHLVKKRSTAKDNRVVDTLTGQVTGASRAAAISMPELVVLNAKNCDQAILECIKPRGGDAAALKNMREQIARTGSFSMKPIIAENSRPKVLSTINSLLNGMMLQSTI